MTDEERYAIVERQKALLNTTLTQQDKEDLRQMGKRMERRAQMKLEIAEYIQKALKEKQSE